VAGIATAAAPKAPISRRCHFGELAPTTVSTGWRIAPNWHSETIFTCPWEESADLGPALGKHCIVLDVPAAVRISSLPEEPIVSEFPNLPEL
jgi:hypothetical protein